MKPLAFVALLAPFVLFAVLLGAAITTAHRQAATPAGPSTSTVCEQHQQPCAAPAATIITLPTVTVYADASHMAAVHDERSELTRWLAKLKVTTAPHESMVMPYYSFATPNTTTATTDKG